MKLKNIRLGQEVSLSHDLMWTDEFNWSPVVSNVERTLSGALVIDTAQRQNGRPISLSAPREEMAWTVRSTVEKLALWATVPDERFLLMLDNGQTFNVVFRHQDAPVIEASPVRGHTSFADDDFWHLKLKFMEI